MITHGTSLKIFTGNSNPQLARILQNMSVSHGTFGSIKIQRR